MKIHPIKKVKKIQDISTLNNFRKQNTFETTIDDKINKLKKPKIENENNISETQKNKNEKISETKKINSISNPKKKIIALKSNQKQVKTSQIDDKNDNISFEELNLSRPILKAINDLGYVKPTPIQSSAIPVALSGKDILGNAVTGSGKSAAFLIPILERLIHSDKRIRQTRVLILTPTRELAAQLHLMTNDLSKYSNIQNCFISGGLASKPQETMLRNRPDIVIATPGRLIDHLRNTQSFHLDNVEILVLDEADRLLEECFIDELNEIVRMCPRERQTMLYSATLSSKIDQLVKLSLKNPKHISVDSVFHLASGLDQEFIRIRPQHDTDNIREAIIFTLCTRTFHSNTIIFLRTKIMAHRLKIIFGLVDLKAAELHGNLTQLQRLDAVKKFGTKEVDFLLCTDLAARGLDLKGVECIILSHMPNDVRTYIHRVGRTARAGKKGRSVTLVGNKKRNILKQVIKHETKGTLSTRKMVPSHIEKSQQTILSYENDIKAIFKQEMAEKDLRMAQMEANKIENVIKYQDEILNRPKRTWFQNKAEKIASKMKGMKELDQTEINDKKLKLGKIQGNKGQDLNANNKIKSKKELMQSLKTLSRKKRRRELELMNEIGDNVTSEDLLKKKLFDRKKQKLVARRAKKGIKRENGNEEKVKEDRKLIPRYAEKKNDFNGNIEEKLENFNVRSKRKKPKPQNKKRYKRRH